MKRRAALAIARDLRVAERIIEDPPMCADCGAVGSWGDEPLIGAQP